MSLPEHTWHMQMRLNLFNAWLPEGKREKWRMGKERTRLLNPWTVFGQKRGPVEGSAATMVTHPRVCTSEIRKSSQWPARRLLIFGGQGPFQPPWLPHAVWRLLQEQAQLPAMEWGAESWHCARSWNRPKLTVIYHPGFPWKLQSFSRLQTFK